VMARWNDASLSRLAVDALLSTDVALSLIRQIYRIGAMLLAKQSQHGRYGQGPRTGEDADIGRQMQLASREDVKAPGDRLGGH